ncbi:MAG TPA: hypothetical protein VK174_06730 [Chitinophagales bacterium]|nr:hypothetical protein [Chitinophagales bacterium]
MRYIIAILILFGWHTAAYAQSTSRLVIPNLSVNADTTGKIQLPAIQADVFREGVNFWTNDLPYIYTGGDSSLITLNVKEKNITVSIKAAVENGWINLKAMIWDMQIKPSENIRLQRIVTKNLSLGQQAETTNVPLSVFGILAKGIKEPEDHGIFAMIEKGYSEEVKNEIYLQDKAKALSEFVTAKLDTAKHAYWKVHVKSDTVFIHETLDSVNQRMPYKDVLSKLFGVGFFTLDKFDCSITIDKATHKPLLYISGKYDKVVPINVQFSSDYKVKGIAHILRWDKKDEGILELHFWREVDIERYFLKSEWWCPIDVTGTWHNFEDNQTPLNLIKCPAIKTTKVRNIHILF